MPSYFIPSNHSARLIWRLVFWAVLLIILLLATYSAASAQCVKNPTDETAVGLQNASSYYLTLYIDGQRMAGVPAGDKSVDFVVTPGSHTLLAEAVVGGETVTASRTADIPEGYVCTWTVTDPPASTSVLKARPDSSQRSLRDSLRRKRKASSVVRW